MRHLRITVGNNWAEAKGYGSRDLLIELTGRPPIFSRRSRAWCTTPHRVPDLVALAEARGYFVTLDREVDHPDFGPESLEDLHAGLPECVHDATSISDGLW